MSCKPFRLAIGAVVAATLLVSVAAVPVGCHSPAHAATPIPAVGSHRHSRELPAQEQVIPVSMAAIGDSITAFTDGAGKRTPWSWVRTTATGRVSDAGGYRHAGDDTAQILAGTTPVRASVVVVMAGTNDIRDGSHPVPTAQTLANITGIFAKAAVDRKVLSAVAPKDSAGATLTLQLNQQLQNLAARSGWWFVDPWSTLRTVDGHWKPGTTTDGLHPTAKSGEIAGSYIRQVVLRAASWPRTVDLLEFSDRLRPTR